MVEGHSVHRVAHFHRQRFVGKAFDASSPNGRFVEGAARIHRQIMVDIQALGKNLFAFFENDTVVHIHFGMAGAWAVYDGDVDVPPPTKTNRLRLINHQHKLTADLSAMTVQWGAKDLYEQKRLQLGQDPLREDADVELLWQKVQASKKSIGALVMDQSFFCGPGNIYRAEILFKAGVHPDIPGNQLTRDIFDRVWYHTVALLRRGFETGSILTVDPQEAIELGQPKLRRYIYNASHCPRCQSRILTWDIASRTCYACPTCQPRQGHTSVNTPTKCHVPFVSHCAPESSTARLATSGPAQLTVAELMQELKVRGVALPSSKPKKQVLISLLEQHLIQSSTDAAAEKALANESLAVEHIAELAPGQARKARAAVVTPSPTKKLSSPKKNTISRKLDLES